MEVVSLLTRHLREPAVKLQMPLCEMFAPRLVYSSWIERIGAKPGTPRSNRRWNGGFPIYGPKSGLLMQSMVAAGFYPKAVSTILISHLHGDHIYGLMDKETNATSSRTPRSSSPAAELKMVDAAASCTAWIWVLRAKVFRSVSAPRWRRGRVSERSLERPTYCRASAPSRHPAIARGR